MLYSIVMTSGGSAMPPHSICYLTVALGLLALNGAAGAQSITFDGRFSSARLTGPSYMITAPNGRQSGGNLWFSFGQFNVGPKETATFSGPGSVNTIVGTVSGGTASQINGVVQSAIPGASLDAAALDFARAVCRRAERHVCALQDAGQIRNPELVIYLNRLSDLLWLLARQAEDSPG